MHATENLDPQTLARWVGWSLLGTILIGIVSTLFVVQDIDINLTADVVATAENMLKAELALRAKAYIAVLLFAIDAIISVGLFLLLRKTGALLALWSLLISFAAAVLILLGAMFSMNAAEIASNAAYGNLTNEAQRLMLAGLQATSSYTSFHLGLILSAMGMAGFFYLFFKSNLIPKIIAGWGLFASIFVAVTIVARDFIPILGNNAITAAFMASNLIAIVSTGLYLVIRGVRTG